MATVWSIWTLYKSAKLTQSILRQFQPDRNSHQYALMWRCWVWPIVWILTSVRRHSTKFLLRTTRRVYSSHRLGWFDFPSSMRMGASIVQFIVVSNSDWFVFVCNQNLLPTCPVHIDWSASGIFHMCDLNLRPKSVAINSLNSTHLIFVCTATI